MPDRLDAGPAFVYAERRRARAESPCRGVRPVKGKRLFLIVQSVLCALTAGALAAAAVRIYAEGAAAQASGDLFAYIYTREKAGAALLRLLPLIAAAVAVTIAGLILGIRDERADRPVRDEKTLRSAGNLRETAVSQQAGRKEKILRAVLLAAALLLIAAGILNGGLEDVLAKGAAVCTECIGLG